MAQEEAVGQLVKAVGDTRIGLEHSLNDLIAFSTQSAKTVDEQTAELAAWSELYGEVSSEREELKNRLSAMKAELDLLQGEKEVTSESGKSSFPESEEVTGKEAVDEEIIGKPLKQPKYIVLLINNTQGLFRPRFFKDQWVGGQEAATSLRSLVSKISFKHQVVINLYFNKQAQNAFLINSAFLKNLDSFYQGFNSVDPYITAIDCASSTVICQGKMNGALTMWAKSDDCKNVVVSGSNSARELKEVIIKLGLTEYRNKITVLAEDGYVINDMRPLGLKIVDGSHILTRFDTQKHASYPDGSLRKPAVIKHLTTVSTAGSEVSNSLKPGSKSNRPIISSGKDLKAGLKTPTPGLALSKHDPPPCNRYYLTDLPCNPACPFAHNFNLTPEQIKELGTDAKKSPCSFLLRGMTCPEGDECHLGHRCPFGSNCTFGSACRFTPRMHHGSKSLTRRKSSTLGKAAFVPAQHSDSD